MNLQDLFQNVQLNSPKNKNRKAFPNKFYCNGSDHFQVLLDRHIRAHKAAGNFGCLILKLKGKDAQSFLRNRVNEPAIQWLSTLNLKTQFLGSNPCWISTSRNKKFDLVVESTEKEDLDLNEIKFPDFNLKVDSLIKIKLIDSISYSFLCFYWHHALLDARGAEHICKFLIGELDEIKAESFVPKDERYPVLELLNQSREAKDFLLKYKGVEVSSLRSKSPSIENNVHYSSIEFSETESKAIKSKALQYSRLALSPYYLAAAMHSFNATLKEQNIDLNFILVPVPQDKRKRGSTEPVLGNQVSYLFYRLFPDSMGSLEQTCKEIASQLKEQIKNQMPKKYAGMMNMFRKVPMRFYEFIVKGPTKGKFASFYFSDTGQSLNVSGSAPLEVLDAAHLPPASKVPGLTLIFMEFKGKLKIIIASAENSIQKKNVKFFQKYLINSLLNEEASKV